MRAVLVHGHVFEYTLLKSRKHPVGWQFDFLKIEWDLWRLLVVVYHEALHLEAGAVVAAA